MNKDPELVDLGLPSGNLWMKYNLGTNSEEEFGNYYQWGSLKGYSVKEAIGHSYWVTCPFNNRKDTFDEEYFLKNRYKWVYKNGLLRPNFDIVTQTYGENYKIPTDKDFQELIDNTTSEFMKNYKYSGKNGRLFISKINGNTIFIPFSGYTWIGRFIDVDNNSCLWSSRPNSINSRSACHFYCLSDHINLYNANRSNGFALRGIKITR